jgi:hypothetical protein
MTKRNSSPSYPRPENIQLIRRVERLRHVYRLAHEQQVALIAEARAARLKAEQELMTPELR